MDHGSWSSVPNTVPVIALAFVFHNVIPVVAATLEGDMRKIRTALVAGTAIPFVMFVLWDAAVLGSVSADDAAAAAAVVAGGGSLPDPLATLRRGKLKPCRLTHETRLESVFGFGIGFGFEFHTSSQGAI